MNTADRDNTDHETGHDTGQRLANPFAALAEAGMARGPRFDPPPPQPGSQDLEHVLQGVEDLSQGIETLLRTASTSAIGGALDDAGYSQHTQPTAMVDRPVNPREHDLPGGGDVRVVRDDRNDHETDHEDVAAEDDDEIMRVFDEDEPSDIHAIDRMLARQADEHVAQFSEAEVADEETRRLSEPGVSHAAENAEDSGVLAVIGEPVLEPLQSTHSGERGRLGRAGEDARAPQRAVNIESARAAVSHTVGATGDLQTGTAAAENEMPVYSMTANAAAPHAERALEEGSADVAAGPSSSPRKKSPGFGAARAVRGAAMEALAMVNLPLCVVPASLKSTVNVLAVTLALWAPAVWWLAPRLAERAAAASSAAMSEDPAHHQSALREASAAHGESGGGSHGGH